MSISNDIDEVSACIVCPKCKFKSPKDWFAYEVEVKRGNRSKLKKSRVYFKCLLCDYTIEVFDKKLIKFIYRKITMDDGENFQTDND